MSDTHDADDANDNNGDGDVDDDDDDIAADDDLQQEASRQAGFVWPEVSEGQARTQSPQLVMTIMVCCCWL